MLLRTTSRQRMGSPGIQRAPRMTPRSTIYFAPTITLKMSREIQSLSDPISAERPCGVNLEDSPLLASFDAYRVFGQVTAPDPKAAPNWAESSSLNPYRPCWYWRLVGAWPCPYCSVGPLAVTRRQEQIGKMPGMAGPPE